MLSWEFPPSPASGTAAHVDGLARAMHRAGHEVVLITRSVAGTGLDAIHDGVRVLRVDADMPWLPDQPVAATASANHAFVAATVALGDWRPDIVHAHDWDVAWAADVLAALFASRSSRRSTAPSGAVMAATSRPGRRPTSTASSGGRRSARAG